MAPTIEETAPQNTPPEATGKKNWQSRLLAVASIVLVVVLMVALYVWRDRVAVLGNWGYVGAFLIGLIGNATVILPMPSLLLLFALGATFNPILIGVVGAFGGTFGELTGYAVGVSGRYVVKDYRMLRLARNWMHRWGFLALFLFALIPLLPMDVAGIAAGMVRYKVWKFLVAVFIGKAILYVIATLGSVWGWTFVSHLL